MSGSGLQDVLEQLYASNAVTHILSGKSAERVIPGTFLVDATLKALLLSKSYHVDLSIIDRFKEVDSNDSTEQLAQTVSESQDNNNRGGTA